MKHGSNTDTFIMGGIMILSGALSTMNVWADKRSDVRLSLNDAYMIGLMTGWMFFFMGIVYRNLEQFILGSALTIISFLCIRTQLFVTTRQFMAGMIPHHSMAIHMSKQQLKGPTPVQDFLNSIIKTQEDEINFMKAYLRT